MSLARFLTQTMERLRFGSVVDEYNNPVRDVTPTIVEYPCRLEQTDSQEVTVGRNTQVSNWRVFSVPDADVQHQDQVRIEGVTYEVAGPPAIERAPRGPHHMCARLTFVE